MSSLFAFPVATGKPRKRRRTSHRKTREAAKRPCKRILVVDDNADQANSLGMLLGLMGHEVRLAYDGLEAVTAAVELAPDVALVDIGLPGLNGYEVARSICQHPQLDHTVLVTSKPAGDRKRTCAGPKKRASTITS